MDCLCEWPLYCSGTGTIYCDGCGGDLCVCDCGGEDECPGCRWCDPDVETEDDEADPA